MNDFVQVLRSLGAARIVAMGIAAVGAIAFFVFMASRFSQPQMALLYRGLDLDDSSQIVSRLDALNVPYRLNNDGAEILVPEERVLRLRMDMAQDGLPSGGSMGYEIFDRSDSLGTTSFVQNVNLVRALEGELARSIRSLNRVESARVHLVLPRREVFARNKRQPSASIVMKLRGARLDRSQVEAIQNLVAAAVPELNPARVSIIDSQGRLLARGGDGEDDPAAAPAALDEMREAHEKRLEGAIEALLERTVGFGKVRAEVSADIDFDRITTSSETYDPDSQVARSTQIVEETSESSEGEEGGVVSVENNLPEEDQEVETTISSNASGRTEETVNYEISKTVKTEVRQAGLIRRLSVAVLVDGIYTQDADGNRSYEPRTELELESLTALVQSAIGYDEERGDTVQVVNLKFAELDQAFDETADEGLLMGFSKGDVFRIAEILVLGLVGILVLLLIVRPMINRLLSGEPLAPGQLAHQVVGQIPGPGGAVALPGSPEAAALIGPDGAPIAALPPGEEDESEAMIDLEKVEGQVKASSLKKIGEIVDKHPEQAIGIMRQWMYEET